MSLREESLGASRRPTIPPPRSERIRKYIELYEKPGTSEDGVDAGLSRSSTLGVQRISLGSGAVIAQSAVARAEKSPADIIGIPRSSVKDLVRRLSDAAAANSAAVMETPRSARRFRPSVAPSLTENSVRNGFLRLEGEAPTLATNTATNTATNAATNAKFSPETTPTETNEAATPNGSPTTPSTRVAWVPVLAASTSSEALAAMSAPIKAEVVRWRKCVVADAWPGLLPSMQMPSRGTLPAERSSETTREIAHPRSSDDDASKHDACTEDSSSSCSNEDVPPATPARDSVSPAKETASHEPASDIVTPADEARSPPDIVRHETPRSSTDEHVLLPVPKFTSETASDALPAQGPSATSAPKTKKKTAATGKSFPGGCGGRATHFIALQVDSIDITSRVSRFQSKVVEQHPGLELCKSSPEKFHVTLLVFSMGEAQYAAARCAMQVGVRKFVEARGKSLRSISGAMNNEGMPQPQPPYLQQQQYCPRMCCSLTEGVPVATAGESPGYFGTMANVVGRDPEPESLEDGEIAETDRDLNFLTEPQRNSYALNLDLRVLGCFGTKVLFLTFPPDQQTLLQDLHSCLAQEFAAKGIAIVGSGSEWNKCFPIEAKCRPTATTNIDIAAASASVELATSPTTHAAATPTHSGATPGAQSVPAQAAASPAEASPAEASPAEASPAEASPAEANPAEATPSTASSSTTPQTAADSSRSLPPTAEPPGKSLKGKSASSQASGEISQRTEDRELPPTSTEVEAQKNLLAVTSKCNSPSAADRVLLRHVYDMTCKHVATGSSAASSTYFIPHITLFKTSQAVRRAKPDLLYSTKNLRVLPRHYHALAQSALCYGIAATDDAGCLQMFNVQAAGAAVAGYVQTAVANSPTGNQKYRSRGGKNIRRPSASFVASPFAGQPPPPPPPPPPPATSSMSMAHPQAHGQMRFVLPVNISHHPRSPFGSQTVTSLELLEMSQTDDDGYYRRICRAPFVDGLMEMEVELLLRTAADKAPEIVEAPVVELPQASELVFHHERAILSR